ncbi:hypothetical protein CYMTET_21554 [Cymbomonas tetramitiformis]|uniref:Uncharacterized protein n=1 Tax=Cymbomonas tetramitiformis TaxID=36881 RepID=A0AAE0G1Q8_9CHLO|nr:hypothetical protein CYMTET_21554 [Cymbomonas tetramitiformis]
MHYQKTSPEGHWPTHFNEAVSKWGATKRPSPGASVDSEDIEWTGPHPSHPFMPQPVTRTFADVIGATGFTAEAPDSEPPLHMNMMSAAAQTAGSDGYATSTDDEDVAPPQPPLRPGCDRPIPGFGQSLLTSSMTDIAGATFGDHLIPLSPDSFIDPVDFFDHYFYINGFVTFSDG